MKEKTNLSWPDTDHEREERIIKQRAHQMIQKGKLDLYEYALYIERELSLNELIEVVEKQIRKERSDELYELTMQDHD